MQSVTEQNFVLVERPRPQVAQVTLNRPERMNSMAFDVMVPLQQVLDELTYDNSVRAIVLTGAGRGFSSGADHKSAGSVPHVEGLTRPTYALRSMEVLDKVILTLRRMHQPVIAAVNGAAIGAGTQLAIAADFRVVAERARFAVPTARLGLAVDPWTIRRLALLAGNGVARRLLLACDELDAAAAVACGLADRSGGLEEALEWARAMAVLAPLTQAYSKRALNGVFESDLDEPLASELTKAFEACWSSEDVEEGRRARAEKRAPVFRGR